MKRFLVFNLADTRAGETGASKNFVGAYATAAETMRVVRKLLFVEVYDGLKEKFLDKFYEIRD